MKKIKSVAVLTSGGDSPGMNAAIRALVRAGIYHKIKVWGVSKGYQGLIAGHYQQMSASSVGGILHQGGTILQTSRSLEFLEKKYRLKAFKKLQAHGIEALIVIGGDGSFRGAQVLHQETDLPVIGIPGTIDNDISGSDYTIGFDTAVQTATEAIDKIRDTASSHGRTFLVEVMGRRSSAIALQVGLCSGAESVILPNTPVPYDELINSLHQSQKRKKKFSIIIVAEGKKAGRSYNIAQNLSKKYQQETRVCILGHIQRGGRPTSLDRSLASQMGHQAIEALLEKKENHALTMRQGSINATPLEESLSTKNQVDLSLLKMIQHLSI